MYFIIGIGIGAIVAAICLVIGHLLAQGKLGDKFINHLNNKRVI